MIGMYFIVEAELVLEVGVLLASWAVEVTLSVPAVLLPPTFAAL